MYAEDEHVAHPRLYGAPAYARPPLSIEPIERPLDPDDFPIAAEQTAEEQAIAEVLISRPYVSIPLSKPAPAEPDPQSRAPRVGLASRILGRAS